MKTKTTVVKVMAMLLALVLCAAPASAVLADEGDATLASLEVRALDSSWYETEVLSSFVFDSSKTEYNIVLAHDAAYIQISAATTESDAYTNLSDYNYFSISTGENVKEITVTSSDETTLTYTLNITVLTEDEETAYIEKHTFTVDDLATTEVDGETYYISPIIPDNTEIPNGFSESTYTYNDYEYDVLVNEKKGMNVFYLYSNSDLSEGALYVLDESGSDGDEFYLLINLKVKSRMYTIVPAESVDTYEDDAEYLDEFTLTEITISDETVEAWEMEDDGDFYLVYAVNWDGEASLYCYDAEEECLQRYSIDSSTIAQLEAAGESYTDLQSKYNDLVSKYNSNNSLKWKIIAVLAIVCVILVFVILNLVIRLKSSAGAKSDGGDDGGDDDSGNDGDGGNSDGDGGSDAGSDGGSNDDDGSDNEAVDAADDEGASAAEMAAAAAMAAGAGDGGKTAQEEPADDMTPPEDAGDFVDDNFEITFDIAGDEAEALSDAAGSSAGRGASEKKDEAEDLSFIIEAFAEAEKKAKAEKKAMIEESEPDDIIINDKKLSAGAKQAEPAGEPETAPAGEDEEKQEEEEGVKNKGVFKKFSAKTAREAIEKKKEEEISVDGDDDDVFEFID